VFAGMVLFFLITKRAVSDIMNIKDGHLDRHEMAASGPEKTKRG
jgi:hypothetical protein